MTKKRMWGKIEGNLQPGDYTVVAENNYQIDEMAIHKGIEISTAGILGGFNLFFPVSFGLAGLACIITGIFVHFKLKRVEYLPLSRNAEKLK